MFKLIPFLFYVLLLLGFSPETDQNSETNSVSSLETNPDSSSIAIIVRNTELGFEFSRLSGGEVDTEETPVIVHEEIPEIVPVEVPQLTYKIIHSSDSYQFNQHSIKSTLILRTLYDYEIELQKRENVSTLEIDF